MQKKFWSFLNNLLFPWLSLCLLQKLRNIFIFPISIQLFLLASIFVLSYSLDGRSLPVNHGWNIPLLTFLDPSYNIHLHPQSFIELTLGFVASWAWLSGLWLYFKDLSQSFSHLLPPRFSFHTPTEQKIKSMTYLKKKKKRYSLQYCLLCLMCLVSTFTC